MDGPDPRSRSASSPGARRSGRLLPTSWTRRSIPKHTAPSITASTPARGSSTRPQVENDRENPLAGGQLVAPPHDATINIYDLKDQPATYDNMGGEQYPNRTK